MSQHAPISGQISLPPHVEMLMPGDRATLEVNLYRATAIEVGLTFAMREGKRTIAVGRITQILK